MKNKKKNKSRMSKQTVIRVIALVMAGFMALGSLLILFDFL